MSKLSIKNFGQPDERRPFTDKGYLDMLQFERLGIGRAVFEPGWRWSTHVGPIAGTASCLARHFAFVVSGRLHIRTDDGEEGEVAAGECFALEPGHDAWVVGNETCVVVDFGGFQDYAKPQAGPPAYQGEQPQPSM